MVWKLSRVLAAVLLSAVCAAVAACSSLVAGGPVPDGSQPLGADIQIGNGAIKVGLIAKGEVGVLSDGASDSAARAAQLAAGTLLKSPITLVVRHYDGSKAGLDKAESDLLRQGVKLVIGPDDDEAARSLAGDVGRKGVPVISLSSVAAPDVNLFSFGTSSTTEAPLIVDEMRRRGIRSIALVSDPNGPAKVFASQLASAATTQKVQVISLDGSDAGAVAARLTTMASVGQVPSAIVFLESASAAGQIVAKIRAVPALAWVPVIGTSLWAYSPGLLAPLAPGWYLAPEANGIAAFAQRFSAAYGQAPSPAGALTYDLVVMAAALPQLFPDKSPPYGRDILTNDQGFVGVTGNFWFSDDGQVHRNLLPVDIAPKSAATR